MFRFRLLVLLVCLASLHPLLWAVSEKSLSPRFRHWLNVEVPYIIQSEERASFLALKSDAERDNFIRIFWNIRNPTPGGEINTYKEEHYRRLAYANQQYGDPKLENGWSTDQGRLYITLGEPQSRVTYPNSRNVRPLVIWFYQAPTPALPPFFYIVFYKRSAGDPYTLYSPYQDGPSRLTTGLEDLNVQSRSLQTIRKSLGDEVARTIISLIPSEPVNLNDYSPSMTSDTLLATIKGLPDNYLQKRQLANRRSAERVTASILSTANAPTAAYAVSHDAAGQSTVNYLITFPEPDASLMGQRKDKTLGYDMTLQSHVSTESGKPVYDQVEVLAGKVEPRQLDIGSKKAFAAEDRFPLVPGTYVVTSTLTNNLNLQAHRLTEKVVVPLQRPSLLGISEPVVYSGSPTREGVEGIPFMLADLRFAPKAIHTVSVHAGDRIPCVFQLWLPKNPAGEVNKAPVLLHYLFGSALLSGKSLEESDETLDASNADAAGNLVSGHIFSTNELTPGSYRAVIRATQAGSPTAFATLTIHVVGADVAVDRWSAYAPPEPSQDGAKRELALKAQETPAPKKSMLSLPK